MDEEEIFEYLKENLKLNIRTTSNYTGDMNGTGSLYEDSHVIELVLEGQVISEEYL